MTPFTFYPTRDGSEHLYCSFNSFYWRYSTKLYLMFFSYKYKHTICIQIQAKIHILAYLTVSASFCFLLGHSNICYQCKSATGSCVNEMVICPSGTRCASIASSMSKLSLRVNSLQCYILLYKRIEYRVCTAQIVVCVVILFVPRLEQNFIDHLIDKIS